MPTSNCCRGCDAQQTPADHIREGYRRATTYALNQAEHHWRQGNDYQAHEMLAEAVEIVPNDAHDLHHRIAKTQQMMGMR